MSARPTAPYAALGPDLVLDAVEAAGFATDGRLLALPSYENRVYQVGLDGAAPLVVKFYRPARWSDAAIAEEHAFALELAAAELPVVAPLVLRGVTLLQHAGFRYALYPRRGGRAPELESREHLAWMGRLLARLHGIGARAGFTARGALDAQTFIRDAAHGAIGSGLLPAHVIEPYRTRCAALATLVEARFAAIAPRRIRLHGDCHAGNVLWTDGGPHFVDLDDARMGPAVQDLWMLVSGDAHTMQAQLAQLLEGYRAWCDFDPREQRLIEPLRALRMLRHSAWLALRHDDPAFPAAFPFFGTAAYWSQQTAQLREQIELIAQAA